LKKTFCNIYPEVNLTEPSRVIFYVHVCKLGRFFVKDLFAVYKIGLVTNISLLNPWELNDKKFYGHIINHIVVSSHLSVPVISTIYIYFLTRLEPTHMEPLAGNNCKFRVLAMPANVRGG
jgi:hypothetical protein